MLRHGRRGSWREFERGCEALERKPVLIPDSRGVEDGEEEGWKQPLHKMVLIVN